MNLQDSSYQFTYFKDSLLDLKIKIYQANNMVNVLLAKLANHRRDHKAYSKLLKKQ